MRINTANQLDQRTLANTWQLPVLSSIDTPPSTPVNGARYRIIADAVEEWEGKENQIAIWDYDNQAWFYETYGEGSILYDLDANDYRYVKPDGSWEQFDKIPLAISDVTGLQSALDGKASTTHAIDHVEGGSDELTGQLNASALVRVRKDDDDEITNKILNFIDGTNISITTVDNGDNIDITINSTASSVNEFAQNLFKILGETDPTKKLMFDVDTLLTTGTTVTKKIQNTDGTLAELEGDQVFTALIQSLTMIATESLTTAKIILTDSETDPVANGEIQMNGTTPKVMGDGIVRELGRISLDDNVTIEGSTHTLREWLLL